MTSHQGKDRQQRIQAARVGARVELLDLRIRRIEAELHRPAAEGPFSFTLDVKPSVSRLDALVVYDLGYAFSAKDSDDHLILDGSVDLSVLYQASADDELTDDDLIAFGQVSVLFQAYPYLREILHSLTGRMGLPPLILEVMRSPLDVDPSEAPG